MATSLFPKDQRCPPGTILPDGRSSPPPSLEARQRSLRDDLGPATRTYHNAFGDVKEVLKEDPRPRLAQVPKELRVADEILSKLALR